MTLWPVRPMLYAEDVDPDRVRRAMSLLAARVEAEGWAGGDLGRVIPNHEQTRFGTDAEGAEFFVDAETCGDAANIGLALLEDAFREAGVTPGPFYELCIYRPRLRTPEPAS